MSQQGLIYTSKRIDHKQRGAHRDLVRRCRYEQRPTYANRSISPRSLVEQLLYLWRNEFEQRADSCPPIAHLKTTKLIMVRFPP